MMRIYDLTSKRSIFNSTFNYSVHFVREKYKSSEFDFFESKLRRVYAKLAFENNWVINDDN
jgi:hypothetical protein